MRVALDVSAIPASPAGAGRYVVELTTALAAIGRPELVLISRRDDAERWRRIGGPGTGLYPRAPGARPLRIGWEQLALPRALRRLEADVHHGPHYTMPERADRPVVVTVHDCTFFDHPEWHERSKVVLFRRAIKVAAKRAAAIVCVSATTARHLAAVCTVEAPVVVAPHGVDHARFIPQAPAGSDDRAAVTALGLDPGRPRVVFVGTVEPRKDVATLIRAYAEAADTLGDLDLVVAGHRGWGGEPVQRALAAAQRHAGRIHLLGYVPDDAVPALLRTAAVVAYPSLAEGYGLPALEALACGAPLVTTAGTAMAELAGDAAVLTQPGDAEGLAAALSDTVSAGPDDPAVARRRTLGLAAAAARTWRESARLHIHAYRIAASTPLPGRRRRKR